VIGVGLVRRPSLRRGVGIVLGAAIAVVIAFQLNPTIARRSYGPEWAPQVAAAAARCATEPASEPVSLTETLGWRVDMTCGQILRRPKI
jgi:hypothetical protein